MSLHESPLLRRYWQQVGGVLVEEFPAVRAAADRAPRYIDGIIIHCTETRVARPRDVTIRGAHITIVQVKRGRLGMYLMGQALFSIDLVLPFGPASWRSIALCEKTDAVLQPLFERHANCHVVVIGDVIVDAGEKSRRIG